ncbi:hypothetical protein [Fulvivirga lutimaris]|uniref:hypothetical protein n=1 Tax=Fulvivirga lutimaris TaxID=1819566 RepID=UPI0012BC1D3F|nr:hypothetical protein [Fulvivirga lutimaris]MTI38774.1 hypothetical protein [Fulvivirga lutimaris]
MKNIKVYMIMLAAVAMLSTACDPLEDDIDEIKQQRVDVKDLVYTLTDDDYDISDEVCECSGFGNFSSEDDVKEGIPVILNTVFPALGKGSTAAVTYDFYNGSSPDLRRDYFQYTVSDAEYEELGYNFGNFDDLSNDLPKYAQFKNPDAGDGRYMDVTHDYYNGSFTETDVVSRVVYTVAYGWQYAFILPDEAYGDFFNESGIDFSTASEGRERIPVYLNENRSLFVEEGETLVVQYNFDDRFTDGGSGLPNVPDVGLFIFSNGEWLLYNDYFQTTAETLSFGHDGTTWVPDNTIKYTFTAADFAVAGDEANGLGNAAARDNLRTFGNFGTQWSREEVIEAIAFVLKLNFGDAEVGQKYLVTYNTYPAGDLEALFILDASGEYVEVTE